MIGVDDVRVDGGTRQLCFQFFAHGYVIYPPAFVLCPTVGTGAPPTIVASGFGVQVPEGIGEAQLQEFIHPGTLFRQETTALFVADRIMDIDGLMANVIIAADDKFGSLFLQFGKVIVKFIQPLELVTLPLLPAAAAWEVAVEQSDGAKIGPQHAPFCIALHDPVSVIDRIGRYFGEDGHAAVAFFFGREPVAFVAQSIDGSQVYVSLFRLDFLQADDIRGVGSEPFSKPFIDGAADAVYIIRDEAHEDGCRNARKLGRFFFSAYSGDDKLRFNRILQPLISPTGTMHPLAITIITYNRPDDLLVLLQNIAQQDEASSLLAQVIIINNASTELYDAATDFIKANSQIPWQYVWSDENLGVARGRNKAIALANAPVIITLDDDAAFGESDALVRINQLFSSDFTRDNKIGVLCFKVLYRSTGTLQASAFPHKKIARYRDKDRFLTSYYIGCGHAMLRECYQKAGIYPTDFFYGMEEYDLGYRILNLGYRIAYDSSVHIIHNESPLGRTPQALKLQMMWVNKCKVAYRYLPYRYFVSTAIMWSLEFLKKTGFDWKVWFDGWKKIGSISRSELRQPINDKALRYIKSVEGRLWF